MQLLESWHASHATRLALRGLITPLKVTHFESPEAYAALGLRHTVPPPAKQETKRWREQITDAGAQGGDVELECDVVVVGTGAGGAPVAAELAERGVAVLMLEEGELPRAQGLQRPPLGDDAPPLPQGRHHRRLGQHRHSDSGRQGGGRHDAHQLRHLLPDARRGAAAVGRAGPHRPDAERLRAVLRPRWSDLEVGPSSRRRRSATWRTLIAQGCDALGYSHHPLERNAPGCDGQGLCCFGCPTDAKRSTNVSYVPQALDRGAQLLTGVRVDRVLVEGERAVGVEGVAAAPDGREVTVTVRAKVVVLACGSPGHAAAAAAPGPVQRVGRAGQEPLHSPGRGGVGVFDEDVGGSQRGAAGLRASTSSRTRACYFEGASLPLELHAGDAAELRARLHAR